MSYDTTIQQFAEDPEGLELAYQQAVKSGEQVAFTAAVEARYAEGDANLLIRAWHYRLAQLAAAVSRRVVAWGWALPLGLLNALLLWWLSDDDHYVTFTNPINHQSYRLLPLVLLLAAPISAALISLFLVGVRGKGWRQALAAAAGLAAAVGYVLLLFPQILPRVFQEQYLPLMILHLGLLAWVAVGWVALGQQRDAASRFAFLAKSLEAAIVAGLLAAAWGVFTAVTFGLFDALDIELSDAVQRIFLAGGGGLIILVAVALVYDPRHEPLGQTFDEGLSKLIALLLRLLLPLAVLILLIYLGFIPFNWREPFRNREVLVAFNALLFAVLALLLGVTPVRPSDLSDTAQTWLRRGVIALSSLALVISLYALAAILYRTAQDRLTPNRLLFIGWNIVNIGVLAALLIQQARTARPHWLPSLHRTFSLGIAFYLGWALIGLLVTPWLFRGHMAEIASLPTAIQETVYEYAPPVLLKCHDSPHVYLLEHGHKRWIKDITTFTVQGYRWDYIRYVSCSDLRIVPDGTPIPADAGPAPQP